MAASGAYRRLPLKNTSELKLNYKNDPWTYPVHGLFDFLFNIRKQVRLEKFSNRRSQTIAEFLNCGNRCAVVSPADDVLHCGLCDTALDGKGVDRNISFLADFDDPLPHCLSDLNAPAPLFLQYVRKEYRIPLVKVTSFELE